MIEVFVPSEPLFRHLITRSNSKICVTINDSTNLVLRIILSDCYTDVGAFICLKPSELIYILVSLFLLRR